MKNCIKSCVIFSCFINHHYVIDHVNWKFPTLRLIKGGTLLCLIIKIQSEPVKYPIFQEPQYSKGVKEQLKKKKKRVRVGGTKIHRHFLT